MRNPTMATLLAAIAIATAFGAASACGAGPIGPEAPAEQDEPVETVPSVSTATPVPPSPTPVSPQPASTATPVTVKTTRPVTTASPERAGAQLKMVLIRATAADVEQLRKMPLDIVRVRPVESNQTPVTKKDFLTSEVIVEAVVPVDLLTKLKDLGFDVTEVP